MKLRERLQKERKTDESGEIRFGAAAMDSMAPRSRKGLPPVDWRTLDATFDTGSLSFTPEGVYEHGKRVTSTHPMGSTAVRSLDIF